MEVHGLDVGPRTECVHYRSALDIVAIRFACCGAYYPCFECHRAVASHAPQVWPRERFDQKAILCGACGAEMTINEYLASDSQCPRCHALFNPGCTGHRHLYFENGEHLQGT